MQRPMDWDASLYDRRHKFVWQHGEALLSWLNPQRGETILDAGCGTGHLTAQISTHGAIVMGLDSSETMIEQARAAYPTLQFVHGDILQFEAPQPFDAIFSNAVLHWVQPPEEAARRLFMALKPGGRMVVEFGGTGNVRTLLDAARAALAEAGTPLEKNPWYYPSIGEYATLLERTGLEVRRAELFDRPTPQDAGEAGMANWLSMFGGALSQHLPPEKVPEFRAKTEEKAKPLMYREGLWTLDYRRIRFEAWRKPTREED